MQGKMNSKMPKSMSLDTVQPITIYEGDGEGGTQTGRMRRCLSVPETLWDIRSILKFRTVDESLHSAYGSETLEKGRRSLTFDKVIIREYARTVGDNPSCSSGPPVRYVGSSLVCSRSVTFVLQSVLTIDFCDFCSISWEYNEVGDLTLEEFETTRPPRRSHFEMVLPRKVRQDMLRREWDVTQSQIAASVRRNVRVKNQRKSTVNNLGKATKMEEVWESAGRKFRRALTLKKPVSKQVQDLEKKVNEVHRRRSQLALDMQMASENGSVHSAGNLVVAHSRTSGGHPPDMADTSTSS